MITGLLVVVLSFILILSLFPHHIVSFKTATLPFILILILWFRIQRYQKNIGRCKDATSLGAIPIPLWEGKLFGNFDLVWRFFKDKNDHPGQLREFMHHSLGPVFSSVLFGKYVVWTTEPEHIKIILAKEFENFEKGTTFRSLMNDFLGTGVFNSDGPMWKFHRTLMRPFFHRERISNFHIFQRCADAAIYRIKERINEGYPVNFQDIARRFTFDSAGEYFLGRRISTLDEPFPYPNNITRSTKDLRTPLIADDQPSVTQFALAFEQAQGVMWQRRPFVDYWWLFELWNNKTREPMAIIRRYLSPIIQDALKNSRDEDVNTDANEKDEVLLENLVKSTKDPDILMDAVLNLLVAGRDTTASLITFAIYALSKNPAVLSRLRTEVLRYVGPSRQPIFDDIKELKYLRAVLNETLRLYPPIVLNNRCSITATTLPSSKPGEKPSYIPADTNCLYSVFAMHRRKDLWGPDALIFDPDRFLDERYAKYVLPQPYIFLPFNAGPRICLGQQLAYHEASLFIIRLLQNFDNFSIDMDSQSAESQLKNSCVIENCMMGDEMLHMTNTLTLHIPGGLWIKMRPAHSVE